VKERAAQRKQRSFADSKKYNNTRQGQKEEALGMPKKPTAAAASSAAARSTAGATGEQSAAEASLSSDDIAANIAKLKAGGGPRRSKKGADKGADKGAATAEEEEETGASRRGKERRVWDGDASSSPTDKKGSLDFSKKDGAAPGQIAKPAKFVAESKLDLDAEFGDTDDGKAGAAAPASTSFLGSLSSFVGMKALDRGELQPVLDKLQGQLTAKNVANDIGVQICESVCANMLGKQLGLTTTIQATVRTAMKETLTRILTPTRRVDVLADIAAAKAEKRPYVVVFVGVNGVGKSTSLSKVAYYIKSNGFTPMLCACDTFRAGAVEQLRVHAQSLEVPLYEKGYGRDAAGIATDGISYAKQMGHDVVLVDTAGRMQDNEPLMRALSKLVHVNNPDLVLFVGEALAGNDAVDQVTGFNTALADYSVSRTPRLIDGLVLTKFDTINDKVGAAISLVFSTSKPIVFVGVGQTYADIRNLNVDHVVSSLLK